MILPRVVMFSSIDTNTTEGGGFTTNSLSDFCLELQDAY